MAKFDLEHGCGSPKKDFHRHQNNDQDHKQPRYVGAPYNFIDFPRCWIARYKKPADLPPHDRYVEGLLSGIIDLEWEAETPIFIRQGGREEFFRNHEGFAIPGSSVRGMIRGHVQVLGMCNYRDDIEDQWFLYRDMASNNPRLKEQYRAGLGLASRNKQAVQRQLRGSLPDKLQAGYVEKRSDGKYYIIPAQQDDKGVQIYRIAEKRLKDMNLPADKVKLMYKKEFWLKDIAQMTQVREINNYYDKDNYKPYYVPIYYDLDSAGGKVRKIILRDVDVPEGKMQKGYLLSSGYMYAGTDRRTNRIKPGKLTHYVIRDAVENVPGQEIEKERIDAYNTDLVRKKFKGNKSRDRIYNFYHLPADVGVRKPVFYVETEGKITYFGFTPYLRILYDHSVHQGIPSIFRSGSQLDYGKSLFGFSSFQTSDDQTTSSDPQGYKSRISFGDMQALNNPQMMDDPARLILAEPKATAYPLYLNQADATKPAELTTYNDSEFRLRGMKRYWFKKEEIPNESDGHKKNDNIVSILRPLPKQTCFRGRIRFRNLAEDELGLLLWAIMLEPASRVQIGMGKPYGYGRLKLKRDEVALKIENLASKYGEEFSFANDYLQLAAPEKYIRAYQEYMQANYQIDISQEAHVRFFFQMAGTILANEQVRYMRISSGEKKINEYKDIQPLGSVEEVIKGKRSTQREEIRENFKASNSYKVEGRGENKARPSTNKMGRELPRTDTRNKPAKDLLPWQAKLEKFKTVLEQKKGN